MRLVIDTNVLVSAALSAGRARRVVQFIIDRPDLKWIVSPSILDEYKSVLARRKFGFSEADLNHWNSVISRKTSLIEEPATLPFDRDSSDAKFLACALAARANYLITGDRDFSGIQTVGRAIVIRVADFDELVVKPLEKRI